MYRPGFAVYITLGIMVSAVLLPLTDHELEYIAQRDYGQDVPRHLEALKTVIFEQQGVLREGQQWFPYEAVELGSNSLETGHEREFAFCTVLVVASVRNGFDTRTDLAEKLSDRSADYDRLPPMLREEILNAYAASEA